MKINQPSPNQLNIQVDADLPYLGSLIATAILWTFVIQHLYANNKTWEQLIQSMWETRGTISYELMMALVTIFAIVMAVRLFTTEYVRACTFDRQNGKIEIEKYRCLSRHYKFNTTLDRLSDIQIEITPGGKCKYYSVALIFAMPKRSKLVLPERTIDRETTLERVDRIREFLAIPPFSNIDISSN
jgi:hypothetical protein